MLITVGVGDLKLSKSPDDRIITYALGSCLGITVYDPVAKVGGFLHAMLPLSTIDPSKAEQNPYMFVDSGVPRLFLDAYKLGARKERLVVAAAGGSSPIGRGGQDYFQIGSRNIVVLRKLLWKNGVVLAANEFGGSEARTMWIDMASGEVTLRVNGTEKALLPGAGPAPGPVPTPKPVPAYGLTPYPKVAGSEGCVI